ncbi:MAG: AraC family transcriptional regulator [Lachnospiraceae bacterium]|nr:AraC family transcriptional regulator [Lachnospiraceae bacterium]
MQCTENHVTSDSDYYIYTPSTQAQALFFYPLITGYFHYQPGYSIRRSSFNSFLLMYIRKGSCEIETGDRTYQAHRGQVVMLDCYAPHAYSTDTGWDAEWLHFDGQQARDYFNVILADGNPVITLQDTCRLERYLHKIYLQFKERLSTKEALLNNYIVNILTELLISRDAERSVNVSAGIIEDIIAYISEHMTDELSLEELAGQASLSPFYFSRLFKKETGFSPHGYVIATRVNTAKYLLKSSDETIKNICFSTGFTSESSFCTTFKKVTGSTPSEYRISLQKDNHN